MGNELSDYWSRTVDLANATRKLLDEKPRHLRIGYALTPGAIINAYREGDATFDEAVEAIRAIRADEHERLLKMRAALTEWCERTEAGNAMEAPADQRCTRELRSMLGPESPCTCCRCKP